MTVNNLISWGAKENLLHFGAVDLLIAVPVICRGFILSWHLFGSID